MKINRSGNIAKRRSLTLVILPLLVICLALISAAIGQYPIALGDVLRGFFSHFHLVETPKDSMVEGVLWQIRFPRIVLGLIVGASLAVAGVIMQAVFSNPLAEPSIIGVSSGSAVGASLAIVFAPFALGGFAVPGAAFLSGLAAAFLVYWLARSKGKAHVLTLVLTGIAVQAVCTALTSIATYIAPTTARDQIVFWQMGSLNGASWEHVGIVAVISLPAIACALAIAYKLDTLALGEEAAGHIGVHVGFLRAVAITLSALLTAASVAYAGIIAFVGLIVPHVLRIIIGPLNRYLIPACIAGGALLITLADLATRTLIPFADLPIGIFTALVGGPTFFVLLRTKLHIGRRG